MLSILSNTSLEGIHSFARESARTSFEFFSNAVLGISLEEEVCKRLQDVVEDEEDYVLRTVRPRGVAVALQAWLFSRGVLVVSPLPLPQHETLQWLSLEETTSSDRVVELFLGKDYVEIRWSTKRRIAA